VQLNIKVRAEALDSFYALADRQGWVLGETLEKALSALEKGTIATAVGGRRVRGAASAREAISAEWVRSGQAL
jgi:hypothetical protein